MEEKIARQYYLLPSALFAEREEVLVDTVLGSCVAVCLFDYQKKIGGINHYMLPLWNGDGLASPKFGNIATEKLIEKMLALGAGKNNMVAKIFGGAKQFTGEIKVGEENIFIAQETLKVHEIKIIAQNTGGSTGRKIRFNTATGDVFLKFLK